MIIYIKKSNAKATKHMRESDINYDRQSTFMILKANDKNRNINIVVCVCVCP